MNTGLTQENRLHININDPMLDKYFSKENIDHLQFSIRHIVKNKMNVDLMTDQDNESLLVVMRSLYYKYESKLPTSGDARLSLINKYVLYEILPDIYSSVKLHIAYMNRLNHVMKPVEQPINDNVKGTKTGARTGNPYI